MNMKKQRAVWSSLHKAESLLAAAGVRRQPGKLQAFFEELPLARYDFALLFRLISGFDPQRLTADNYLVRYPFSTLQAIESSLRQLADEGWTKANGDGSYAATNGGWSLVRRYFEIVCRGIDGLHLEAIPSDDLDYLLAMDRKIVRGVERASPSYERPILSHRLKGFHPSYNPPKLSHHWQYAWTLVATHEDAEEAVRKQRNMDPLIWFARRQIAWGRFEIGSPQDLVPVATRYSPIDQAEEACTEALEALERNGWVEKPDRLYQLSPDGRSIYEKDEDEIDELFFMSWPDLTDGELEKLLSITTLLNSYLERP